MKFIARKKTITKTVAMLKNADAVFFTYSAKKVETNALTPKCEKGRVWLKSLVPDVLESFDGELFLPSGYNAVLCNNKLFIKHTEETVKLYIYGNLKKSE